MKQVIKLKDFSGDTRAKLDAACEFCRNHPGTTLFIPAGVYVLEDKRAKEIMDDVFSGRYGASPQAVMFKPDFPYTKGLDLTGCRDVTVSAYGVLLLINGFMEPVSVRDAENTTIEGLTIDHVRKPFTRGSITEIIDAEHVRVRFDPLTPPCDTMPATRNFLIDCHTRRISAYMSYEFGGERVSPLEYIVPFRCTDEQLGSDIYFTNTFHFRPCILISHSKNTKLTDVCINSQSGMGVVGFKSRDIHILRLKVEPSDGYYMSTNTDATHFAPCSGTISMENCITSGHGDDAINVHSYYYRLLSAEGSTAVLRTFASDGNHTQEPDYPTAGFRLQLVDAKTLKPLDEYTVVSSDEREECTVVLDKPLPEGDISEFYFANLTDCPKLIFTGNHVSNHLARCVLCKTRNALIENNCFDGSTGTAVQIAAEGSWGEGISSEDVVVRNNCFVNCGYTSHGTIYHASAVCVNISARDLTGVGIQKNILIESNEVYCPDSECCAFNVSNAQQVTVKHNKVFGTSTPVRIDCSENVLCDM